MMLKAAQFIYQKMSHSSGKGIQVIFSFRELRLSQSGSKGFTQKG